MHRVLRSLCALAIAIAGSWALACGSGREAVAPTPILTSLPPLAMIAREVAGDAIPVSSLLPAGASPHGYEPTPGDVARLEAARIWIRVGGGVDDWAARLEGVAAPDLERLILYGLEPPRGRFDRGHDDPHLWLDPIWVRDVLVPVLIERIGALDPSAKREVRNRGEGFRIRLTHLDRRIKGVLSRARGRSYVAFHAAWRPFAKRYRLEELAVVEEAPGESPTPRTLESIVRKARQASVKAILVEPQLDPRMAEVIGQEFGGRTVLVDPLGGGLPGRDRYEGLMLFNARAFAQALGGPPR